MDPPQFARVIFWTIIPPFFHVVFEKAEVEDYLHSLLLQVLEPQTFSLLDTSSRFPEKRRTRPLSHTSGAATALKCLDSGRV